jgi:hypothetical protein
MTPEHSDRRKPRVLVLALLSLSFGASDALAAVTVLDWWHDEIGGAVRQIGAVPDKTGGLVVFRLMQNGRVWRANQTGTDRPFQWTQFIDMGAHDLREIVVMPNADRRVEVFGLGNDQACYHIWEDATGAWGTWQSLTASVTLKQLAGSRNADGRLEVFAIGSDQAVWHTAQRTPGGSFDTWSTLYGHNIRQLSVTPDGSGALHVFAVGGDHRVYVIDQQAPNGAYGNWSAPLVDATSIENVIPIANADGRLELFARRTGAALVHAWQTAKNGPYQSSWTPFGLGVGEYAVGYEEDHRIVVSAVSAGALYLLRQNAPNGSWGPMDLISGPDIGNSHVIISNNASGAVALLTATSDGKWGRLYEAKANGPWQTVSFDPIAHIRSLSTPASVVDGTSFTASFEVKREPLCVPYNQLTARYDGRSDVLLDRRFDDWTGNAAILTRGTGSIIVQLIAGCGNGNTHSDSRANRLSVVSATVPVSLIASYCFENTVGNQVFDLTVTFTGNGPGGATFSVPVTKQFRPPSGTECVTANVVGLVSGNWTVTARPNGVAAPITCAATVPGLIRIDVSQGQPICRPGF